MKIKNLLLCGLLLAQAAGAATNVPVKHIADQILTVNTPAGTGDFPLFLSRDWNQPQPDITRALLIFHGHLRNADVYWKTANKVQLAAEEDGEHSFLIAPQFLADADITANTLPDNVLHWGWDDWMAGEVAHGPAPISSFEVIDAILRQLANRKLFPNLHDVVVAGHSGGAQIVERYAVVGKAEPLLAKENITVHYVVANPSSYLYFSDERPLSVPASCGNFNHWKYGWQDAPAYAQAMTPAAYEADFVKRHVVYLLGTADTNPRHPALDISCAAETQGPYRLARGLSFFSYLQKRHPDLRTQSVLEVEGVGHDGDAMFSSACGLTALFAHPGCKSQ
jgi:pimeloyl-ACP methyl ester carboxylesterase